MTKKTYKQIDKAFIALRALNLAETLQLEALRNAADEAQNDFDDRSEKWQESDLGIEEIERINQLQSVISEIESVVESIQSAVERIEEIQNNAPEGAFN
jgi:hypothetical protein